LLMPEPAWRQAAGDSDVELAEVFNVPVEQVRRRRTELALWLVAAAPRGDLARPSRVRAVLLAAAKRRLECGLAT
jgi:hypothetical protein